jgi:protein-disulfide isomerase
LSGQEPRRRPRLVGVIVIAVIALVGLGVIASLSLDEGDTDPIEISGAGEVQRLLGGIRQLDERLGHEDAPVTIELFNDLQCKDCADYQLEVIDPLIERHVRPGDAKLIYRHYSMSERATGLADYGAVAAGKQDDQWQFVEVFFRNQDEAARRGVTDEFLDRVAAAILDFNVEQWQRDLEDSDIQETLDADAELAAQRQLPAEPAVVVTGERASRELTESPSLAEIEAAILGVQ